jgi:hypothetical protein
MTPTNDIVLECLQRFRTLVNSNARAKKLLKGWDPVVLVEPTDADARYYLHVRDAEVCLSTSDSRDGVDNLVHVRGTRQELARVFSGEKSAARAVLDASLEVFAADRDQVKLDAITMIIWGT